MIVAHSSLNALMLALFDPEGPYGLGRLRSS
jgi:hypothetical protein